MGDAPNAILFRFEIQSLLEKILPETANIGFIGTMRVIPHHCGLWHSPLSTNTKSLLLESWMI